MSKRSQFTNITALPPGISRETVMETLRSHTEMIDLNPLIEERHPIKPPGNATAEEYHCVWYSLTDKVQYLPGGLASGKVSYTCCFHDLENGLQTHCYAPMGLNIKGKWTLGGSLPGEPIAPVEIGLGTPLTGLWLREDVDMKCNFMMTTFVKKTLQKAHSKLVDRLMVKAQIVDASQKNKELYEGSTYSQSISDQSISDDGNISPFTSTQSNGTQSSSQYNTVGQFRPLELAHLNGAVGTGLGLMPAPLAQNSNRNSNASSRTSSYQDSTSSNSQAPYNPRVSWQNLNTNPQAPIRSPPIPNMDSNPYRVSYHAPPSFSPPLPPTQQLYHQQTSPPPQQAYQQRHSPPQMQTYAAELPSEGQSDTWRNSNVSASSSSSQSQQYQAQQQGPRRGVLPTTLESGYGKGPLSTAAHKGFPVELE